MTQKIVQALLDTLVETNNQLNEIALNLKEMNGTIFLADNHIQDAILISYTQWSQKVIEKVQKEMKPESVFPSPLRNPDHQKAYEDYMKAGLEFADYYEKSEAVMAREAHQRLVLAEIALNKINQGLRAKMLRLLESP